MEDINKIIKNYNNIVFFGGAGVSTESGVPDFRSADGLYSGKQIIPPETILSNDFFFSHLTEFYRFYFEKMIYRNALPNAAHKKLAELEKLGKLKAVITQNIDGLHQAAGSKKVYELHGSVNRNYCLKCNRLYDLDALILQKDKNGVPKCSCGETIKPDVVLYGEALNENTLLSSIKALQNADLVIVGGTSLTVYPAAGLVGYTKGDIMLINKTRTQLDNNAKYVFNQPIAELLSKLKL